MVSFINRLKTALQFVYYSFCTSSRIFGNNPHFISKSHINAPGRGNIARNVIQTDIGGKFENTETCTDLHK